MTNDDIVRALEEVLEGADYYSTPEVSRGPASAEWKQFRAKLRDTRLRLSRYREAKEGDGWRMLEVGEIPSKEHGDQMKIRDAWIPYNGDEAMSLDREEVGYFRRPIRKEQQPNSSNQTL